ncbi:hypothetical protein [Reyranella sp.]|uniref:hypothetical protein n=1 Tax=Reyranella sp. TaxID=1929291 RepID=UPI003BA98417
MRPRAPRRGAGGPCTVPPGHPVLGDKRDDSLDRRFRVRRDRYLPARHVEGAAIRVHWAGLDHFDGTGTALK